MTDHSGDTHLLPGRVTEFRFRRFSLTVVEGTGVGSVCTSESSEITVGTAEGSSLLLTDPTVSGHHCVLQATPTGLLLRDLESTNGTTLAGYKLGSAYLKPGAMVGVGVTLMRFDLLKDVIREPVSREEWFGRAAGRSLAMRRIFAVLPKVAASGTTVLIEGETGTGKTLLAEAIHQASPRADGPFVVLDCGAIPPTLIESELFGHVRGAFTGAHVARRGAFESAHGGTIFLDEIGELPVDMQPNLLRALEDRVVRRVGSTDPVQLDVRVIAATNQDLRQAVNRGTFRSDLFYRLNIVGLRLPPLRERREDIEMLVEHFYEQFQADGSTAPDELVRAFAGHDWPGNVRELRSAVERSILMGNPQLWSEITGSDPRGPESGAQVDVFDESLSFRASKERAMARWERWYLAELVRRAKGNLSQAARSARMDRTHLRELMRRYDIEREE